MSTSGNRNFAWDQPGEPIRLPYPAVKLIIGHHFSVCDDPYYRYWAWFIAAAFYDKDDRRLWQTEIFLGQFSWLNRNGWSPQHGHDLGPPPPRTYLQILIIGTTSIAPISRSNIKDHIRQSLLQTFKRMAYVSSGTNPAFGRDHGPPPPSNRRSYGPTGGYGYSYPYPHQYGYYPPQPYYYGIHGHPYSMPAEPAYMSGNAHAAHYPPMSQGQNLATRPVINPSMPAANLSNSTGGVGCEPGYNYFFPSEHTKIHVFRTGSTPPWQLDRTFSAPFQAVHVPVNTTIGDLLKGFGATNPDAGKNKAIEVHQGGNGKWYKGLSFKGDDDGDMAKTIKSVGWDGSRNGLAGGKPVVYLYVTKG
ncbi:hypothetical protein VM1G_08054 [Cytospora mali]|uniref:Uncharacterized protein n=1 Tax=Cytospora mali TaxID=578113 RepID=A0A194W736_CYTMA|nr:hypothetical protein VM1G_08054 [Valsa mali]